ncbi:MAG: signal peptidase II [Nevskiaceae bacterium]
MAFQYKNVYWLWVSAAVMLLDQVTKQVVVKYIGWTDVLPVVPHLNLVHMHNTGAAFSMLASAPPVLFIVLGVAVSVGILWWMRLNPNGQKLFAAALALILGGALGNVIDRATRGYVIDFIDLYWGRWHFAAFNVADMAISLGAGLVVLDMLLESRRARQSAAAGS